MKVKDEQFTSIEWGLNKRQTIPTFYERYGASFLIPLTQNRWPRVAVKHKEKKMAYCWQMQLWFKHKILNLVQAGDANLPNYHKEVFPFDLRTHCCCLLNFPWNRQAHIQQNANTIWNEQFHPPFLWPPPHQPAQVPTPHDTSLNVPFLRAPVTTQVHCEGSTHGPRTASQPAQAHIYGT